jgi:hypothetical protein
VSESPGPESLRGLRPGPLRNPVLKHRVRLFSLVPLVWESNPKLQGGWCKPNHQPIGRSRASVGARGASSTALCSLNKPISELHAGGGPPRRATSGVAAPCVPPRRLRAAKPSGAHQHAHPARRDPGGSAACAPPCPRASERSPVKFGQRCA